MSRPLRDETPPEWLTESFIENALRKGFKNQDLKIIRSEIKMATSVGDNYGSMMLRVNMVIQPKPGREENLSIVIKTSPTGLIKEELIRCKGNEKEEEALSRTLPAANELLKKAYPDQKSLWASCYHYQRTPDDVMFLEDLRPLGYVLANRLTGLDLDHTLLVLRSLGKFHASTIPVLEKEDPKSLEVYLYNYWSSENMESLSNLLKTAFGTYPDVVLTWSDFDRRQIYSEKFAKIEKDIFQRVYNICKRDENRMNVLIHGDTWVNNFMFRYDESGKPTAMKFVDFQLTNHNNPALDLHHFIYSSVEPKFKFDREALDLFLKTYHDSFQETLNNLQYHLKEPYTFEKLKKDFEDKMFWGFVVFCMIYPMTTIPKKDVFAADDLLEEGTSSGLARIYRREELKESLMKGFQFFETMGVF